jgi:spore germination protein GerM
MVRKGVRRIPVPVLAGGLLAVGVAGLAIWIWLGARPGGGVAPNVAPGGREVTLFVAGPDEQEFLTRSLALAPDLSWTEQVRTVIDALVAKPLRAGDPSLWPFSLRVRSAYLLADGVLVLDLEESVKYNRNASAAKELQAVRSIVRTLTRNFQNVRRVKFLVNGAEEDVLAGHVDVTRPLGPED